MATSRRSVADVVEAAVRNGIIQEAHREWFIEQLWMAQNPVVGNDAEVRQGAADRKRLMALEARSDVAKRYMDAHRMADGGHCIYDLEPSVLIGLAEVLSKAGEETRTTFAQYVDRNINPIMVIPTDWDLRPHSGDAVKAGSVVFMEAANPNPRQMIDRDDIRFMDFLRAFWRRLTAPRNT